MVKKLLLMDTAVYLNLSGERLFSNSYIPSKDVAKVTHVDTSEVFEFANDDIPNIKMSFFAGQKLRMEKGGCFPIHYIDIGFSQLNLLLEIQFLFPIRRNRKLFLL